MARKKAITFDTVREIASKLPGVEESIAYGTPVLRVNGRIFAGIPINREVEPDSAMVYLSGFDERDALLAEDADTYYLKPHYEPHPVVLVRLNRVTREALEDLVLAAHRVVSRKRRRKGRRK
ncbi:MAG TPA: MmcQ/YjbR family DNA-binding protein [Vicinamibacterales bacterium]|nr:MmcQ/YjbR family DNA-binding protein [Vicinamibacterales bacterium]